MLRVSAPAPIPSSAALREESYSGPPTALSRMSPSSHHMASAVLLVPILDEKHHGADLLMIPISNNKTTTTTTTTTTTATRTTTTATSTTTASSVPAKTIAKPVPRVEDSSSNRRTETPAAPTPPPKPALPEGCQDWDAYLSQRKSTATLPLLDNVHEEQPSLIIPEIEIQSPDLNFKHSFEDLGWRDCLAQRQRHPAARPLRRRPSAATVIGTLYAGPSSVGGGDGGIGSSSTASLRSVKRLSNASTLTANTVATAPCILSSRAYKRLSNASTLTTLTMATTSSAGGGKARSIRRINRTRHLRAYYSDGSLLRARRLSVGVSSMADIAERREPSSSSASFVVAHQRQKRFSSASMPLTGGLGSELCAPPPYPPPEKPLPSLPMMEVCELQTKERTRWRELLLRNFQQGSWRRGISSGGR